jgi:hypothetical protein
VVQAVIGTISSASEDGGDRRSPSEKRAPLERLPLGETILVIGHGKGCKGAWHLLCQLVPGTFYAVYSFEYTVQCESDTRAGDRLRRSGTVGAWHQFGNVARETSPRHAPAPRPRAVPTPVPRPVQCGSGRSASSVRNG